MSSSIDSWDEVWDDYEARQAARDGAHAAPRRRSGWRWVAMPAVAVVVFLLGCMAGSAWPVLNLYALVLRQEAGVLLRQVDLRGAEPGLRDALRRHAGLASAQAAPGAGTAAERLLAGMAEEMAAALVRPGALEQVALARRDGGLLPVGDAAAPPLQAPVPGGRGVLSFNLGVARGEGGFGLDLVWRKGGWHALELSVLDPPVVLGAAGVRAVGGAGAVLARRSG